MSDYPIEEIRSRFPGLTRRVNGHQAIFLMVQEEANLPSPLEKP